MKHVMKYAKQAIEASLLSMPTIIQMHSQARSAAPDTVIEGCVDPPCRLPQSQDAVIHMAFPATRDISSMRTVATAYISIGSLTLPIAYDLGQDAITCNSLTNTSCPVSAGEIINYTLRMHIEPFFPVGTSVTIEFQIVDDSNSALVCVRVPIELIDRGTAASCCAELSVACTNYSLRTVIL